MGRPEKLNDEQKNALVGALNHGGKLKDVAEQYGVSELTARRYWKAAKLQAEALAGQVAEQRMTAQEVAAEMNPPEAA